MSTTKTFNRLLSVYYGSGSNLMRRGFWFKLWLLFKGRAYKNRRRRILENQAVIRSKLKMKNLIYSGNPFMAMAPKTDRFRGKRFKIPLKCGKKARLKNIKLKDIARQALAKNSAEEQLAVLRILKYGRRK